MWIVRIDDGRVEILPISARRHAIFGPAYAAVRGFPEAKASAAYASRIKDWGLSIRTSRNGESSRSARPGSAAPGIDRAGQCEAIIDRLPDALTIKLCKMVVQGRRPW
jgi:hypothetical protein